jgi:type II secretory pathway component GspD/PulD (secretin)
MVKPEISNKVGDAQFDFVGTTVFSPIIDTRSLDSNVLIKSGDTAGNWRTAQDEVTKGRNKVPVLGDVRFLDTCSGAVECADQAEPPGIRLRRQF